MCRLQRIFDRLCGRKLVLTECLAAQAVTKQSLLVEQVAGVQAESLVPSPWDDIRPVQKFMLPLARMFLRHLLNGFLALC